MKVHRFRLSIFVVTGLTVALFAAGAAFAADDAPLAPGKAQAQAPDGAEAKARGALDGGAKLLAARAGVSTDATTLTLEFNGEFTYAPTPAGDRLLFVDLPGVHSTQTTESRILQSALVSSYRLVPYVNGEQQGARLEVLLKEPAAVSYQQAAGSLEVKFQAAGQAAPVSPGAAAPALPAAPVPVLKVAAAPLARAVSERVSSRQLRAQGDAIEDVTFSREGEATRVRIVSNGPVEYKSFRLPDPPRLVLDIPNATSRASREIPVGQGPLKAVRVGQYRRSPLVARVVIELDGDVPYSVNRKDDGLEVVLQSRAGSLPPRTPAESKPAAVIVEGEPLKAAGVAAEPEAQSVVKPAPSDTPASEAIPVAPRIEAEPVLSASLRPEATPVPPARPAEAAPLPAPAPPAPANAATAADLPPLAPLNVAAATTAAAGPEPPRTPAPPPGNPSTPQQVIAAPSSVGGGQAGFPAEAAGLRYTGEPISVNLKDVDLKDFFRLIHEISGLNIVLDPAVGGRVTIVLEDVPWDQALDIVLRNNGLVKQLEGNVLRIAKTETVQTEEEAKIKLAAARQDAAERVTVPRQLNYAKAEEMLKTVTKFISKNGQVISDVRTNTLIITDIPQVIPTIDEVIRTLDRRPVQVEIEARVVAASRSFSREIGAQFGFASTAAGGKTIFTGNLVGQNTSPAIVTGLPSAIANLGTAALPLFSNFPAAGANTGFSLLHRSPNAAIDLLITAAETKGIGKLLSRPKIITQNNVMGSVQQGVKIPVQTTVNNTISVQFVDVTLKLQVTPQVTNEGTIFLQVQVANTTIDPGIARINGVPALDTQEATTQVLVQDGGTVVFGGVLQNNNNITIQQVPILGSIPVLGNLFKRTGVTTNTNELLFFLTPKIV